MARTAKEVQQEFAANCGYCNEIIWDLLTQDQSYILKEKIIRLIPDQKDQQDSIDIVRDILFEKVWAQRKYTNGNSLSSIIYVLVTQETNFDIAPESKQWSCHPVFRTRKCVSASDSSACCMIFIDEVGRVYQNWQAYLNNNVLPKGTMLVPLGGVYTFDDLGQVQLKAYTTPAKSVTSQVLAGVDTTSTVAGIASVCVPIAAVLTVPVAAPVLLGAAVVGLITTGYATIRSGSSLVDRSLHDQSIGFGDSEARGDWLGVVGGTVGLGTSGATRALAAAAAASPKISAATEMIIKGMKVSSIVLSGTGVANGVLDLMLKFNDDEVVSVLDLVQVSVSLVLFTHSVSNFRLATKIVDRARNGTMKAYRKELSSKQQQMYDKIYRQYKRINRRTPIKCDLIRNVNDIPAKRYLYYLYEVETCDDAGSGSIFNKLTLDEHESGSEVNSLCHLTQPAAQSSDEQCVSGTCADNSYEPGYHARVFSLSTVEFAEHVEVSLAEFNTRIYEHIVSGESFETVITTVGDIYGAEGLRFFMRLTQAFIDTMLDEIHSQLKVLVSVEAVLYRMMTYCLETYETHRSHEFLDKKVIEILDATHSYFLTLNPNNQSKPEVKCKYCPGSYRLTEL